MTFEQAMQSSGLIPRDVVPDGKWRRCATTDKPKKRNGAYILHPDGRGYWRNWATDIEINSWREDSTTPARRIDETMLARQRAVERERRVRAMQGAREFWQGAQRIQRLHPYIERKGLGALGCAGLRVRQGLLVVPVMRDQWVQSIQTISAEGEKRFYTGAPVRSGSFTIDRPRAAITAFVEGLATGLAVFQSLRQARVVVCFDAGNLLPVAERLRPTGSVVIAADNDHQTQARRGINPGLEKARNVADYLGCGVAYPKGLEGSDWADAMKEWGEGAARRIEREILKEARYVRSG